MRIGYVVISPSLSVNLMFALQLDLKQVCEASIDVWEPISQLSSDLKSNVTASVVPKVYLTGGSEYVCPQTKSSDFGNGFLKQGAN